MFSQTAVCLMNVEVGQILPTILVGSFFPNKYGKPQIPIPIPNAELHERQWRTNLLHEHGSLSLVNTSNIQHLVPHQSAIPEKSQVPIVDSGQRRCDLVITLSLPRFFVRIVLGGGQSSNTSVCSCCHVDTLPLIEWSSEACKPPFPPSQTPSCRKKHPTSNSKPAKPIDLSLLILTLHQFHHSLTNPTTSWDL